MANAANNDCNGKVLSANAFIGTPDVADGPLKLELCNGLYATAAAVTGEMVADKPEGYFFGQFLLISIHICFI
jgi:hypothetical protein